MTKFSVVIPVYNKEKHVYDTLQSVIKQTFENFEIIIIDDGSTDQSIETIRNIKDDRIQIFSKKNEGVSLARNFGAEKATTKNIAFLDADDYWYPNHLEKLLSMIQKFPNAFWFATSYEKVRTKNLRTPMETPIHKNGNFWIGEIDDYFFNSLIDSLSSSSSVCFNKSFFLSLGGFNKNISHGEDTDFWIRAALQSKLIFSNTITVSHLLESSNRSSTVPSMDRKNMLFKKFKEEEKTNSSLKKYLDLNRYSLAIKYKKFGDHNRFIEYASNINHDNLNKKQRLLIKLPGFVLNLLSRFQGILEKLGIRLSSF